MPHRTAIRELLAVVTTLIESRLLVLIASMALLAASIKAVHAYKPGQSLWHMIAAAGLGWAVGMASGMGALAWTNSEVWALSAGTFAALAGEKILDAVIAAATNRINQAGGIEHDHGLPPKLDADGNLKEPDA